MFEILVGYLSKAGSFITSLTIVGGFMLTIYKYTIAKPKEKRELIEAQKVEAERNKVLEHVVGMMAEQLSPLNDSIKVLNHHLEESKRDRENIHRILDLTASDVGKHEERLDSHNERLIVLETRNGVKRYKEIYKGENADEI